MRCKKCGSELQDGAKICEKCGTRAAGNGAAQDEGSAKRKKNNAAVIVLLCVLIAIALFMGVSIGTFVFVDNQSNTIKESYNKRDEAAKETPAPVIRTPEPPPQTSEPPRTALPAISSKTHLAEPSYSVYYDAQFGFSCAYPTHFEKYIDNTTEGRYTLRNSDGTVTLRICAEQNSANITLAQSLSMFTAGNHGQIEQTRTGGTYYIAKVNDNGMCRYRYLVSRSNNLYWFDFTYPKEYESIYDAYTQHLYESFSIKQ